MLSKEEIAKAKERISKSLNDVLFSTLYSQEENEEDERILLAYIEQLETENHSLKIISKAEIEQREQLESKEQKLIDKLEEDIRKSNEIINDQEYKYIDEVIDEEWAKRKYAEEILKFLKGE